MTFLEFKQTTLASFRKEYGQRLGQWCFNVLDKTRPDLSFDTLQNDDPFFQDSKLPGFWLWLEAHWGDDE